MSDLAPNTPSLTDRVTPVPVDGSVVAIHPLGDALAFVLGEADALIVRPGAEPARVRLHDGGILCAASDGARLLTGGDDGRIVSTNAAGATASIATDDKRRWIDRIAGGPDNAVAWSAGKQVFLQTPDAAAPRAIELPSSAGGLAFAPKGFRLAASHYNGVSLWFPNARDAAPERLEWKGSHLAVTFSPDGRFLVTAMQEPMLHGWRLVDGKHMRMSGYSSRVRSVAWSTGGKWLATGGSEQCILWPFTGKDGPMGKQPKALSPMNVQLDIVACHPKVDIVALGYSDGLVLLTRIEDGAEILVKKPGESPVTALGFNRDGTTLGFGTEDGEAGTLALN